MKNPVLYIILFLCLLLNGCSKDDGPEEPPVDPFTRTVMVYLGRDSNLSSSDEDKITPMLAGWDGKGGNLIIYQDLRNEGASLMEVYRKDEENKIRVIEEYGEENSASAEVFGRVIKDMKTLYPADSYGLIFFSHATGWLPESTWTSPRSIGRDGNDEIELSDFAAVIPDNYFDFIVFEACLMAGIDVLYELKDKTPYILASAAEIVSPGFREIYRDDMSYFFSKEPGLISFADKAMEYAEAYYGGTLSIIKTAGLSDLASWLKQHLEDKELPVAIRDLQHFDTYNKYLFFDFEEYFSYLIPEDKKREFSNLIDDCVIYKKATSDFMIGYGGFPIEKHCGITTYIMQDRYPYLNEEYSKLKWYKVLYD